MIVSFGDKVTEQLWSRQRVKEIDPRIQRVALRKLIMIHAAEVLDDLRVPPPGNRLESLSGDRLGQYSIRINPQWRVCFVWTSAGAADVEIVDYHEEVAMELLDPVHPGEVLLEQFLEPLGVTQHRLAVAVGVPPFLEQGDAVQERHPDQQEHQRRTDGVHGPGAGQGRAAPGVPQRLVTDVRSHRSTGRTPNG